MGGQGRQGIRIQQLRNQIYQLRLQEIEEIQGTIGFPNGIASTFRETVVVTIGFPNGIASTFRETVVVTNGCPNGIATTYRLKEVQGQGRQGIRIQQLRNQSYQLQLR